MVPPMIAIDYFRRAQEHRPTDEGVIRAAAVELHQRGLTARDIGQALGLATHAVQRLLGEVKP
jgi:Flp pilus assembly protein TadD